MTDGYFLPYNIKYFFQEALTGFSLRFSSNVYTLYAIRSWSPYFFSFLFFPPFFSHCLLCQVYKKTCSGDDAPLCIFTYVFIRNIYFFKKFFFKNLYSIFLIMPRQKHQQKKVLPTKPSHSLIIIYIDQLFRI